MSFKLQELSPVDARLCLRVERFITGDLGLSLARQSLLLAVSGGADSMALLHILGILRPRLSVELHVMVADHALRPESGAEAEGVLERCESLGISCTARRLDVAGYAAGRGIGLEEAGRILRYIALEEERRRIGASWIATGHQLEDLGEDVLLRLLRGAGWPGLGGMSAADARRHLLRPLLLTPAAALRDFLHRCSLGWFEDGSNHDQAFRRNRIRHSVWPLLLEENPRLGEQIAHLWRIARMDEAYWSARLASRHSDDGDVVVLTGSTLKMLAQAERMRLYMRVISQISHKHGRGQGRGETLFALDAAWREGRGNTRFQFPGGICAEVRRGDIRFSIA